MATFCVPKNLVQKLKDSALAGEVDIAKLYDMSSKERRDFFTGHTDPTLGKLINTEFEKAMISQQKQALTDWAKSVFTPVAKTKPTYKTMLDKIDALNDMGVLNPKSQKAFLEDLVSDKLGISVSADEVKAISQKAKGIDTAQEKLGNDLGSPTKLDDNLAFFKAKKKMDDYLQSLNQQSKLRVLTGTIGRGVMLASVKSPLLNIGSNIEVGLTERLVRRFSGGGFINANPKLSKEYIRMVRKVYQQTGYDLSRMTSLSDSGASGARVLDDVVHAQGKGVTRKVGRVVEDVVFKQLMGAPDVHFASGHFADSVGTGALKLAKGDRTAATKIMEDAMRIAPQTAQGELLRAQGIMDAQIATWTNKSWAADVSLGIRKILNGVSGDIRAGDYLLPFVKTPANVIATGLDYAGMGIPKALFTAVKGIRSGNLGERDTVRSIGRDLVRSGLGLTGAAILAANLKPDDFVGAYDPARKQIEELRNSNTNSVRIGGKWISMDWFGPLSVPMTSILYAKKYGTKGPGEAAFQYVKGAGSAAINIPGVQDVGNFVSAQSKNANQTLGEASQSAMDYVTSQIYSRLTPSIVSDTAKATDQYERKGGKGINSIKAKIPGMRQDLPIQQNVFGQKKETENPLSIILFGSRVKTDKEDATIKEINRVATSNDKGVTFTDWSTSSSKTLGQFKAKVGQDEYEHAAETYGRSLKKKLDSAINTPAYKKMSDQDKLKYISNQDTDTMKSIFKLYNFKYKKAS